MSTFATPVGVPWLRPQVAPQSTAPVGWEPRWQHLAILYGAHAALALAMRTLPPLATLHAVATIIAILGISLFARRPVVLLFCACYVTGAEVLWRMSKSFIFHETAKYVVALLCLVGIFRIKGARIPGSLLLYFALLLPSVVITYYSFSFDGFRKSVLFNLSGPITIMAAISFCANLEARAADLWKAILAMSAPAMGVAAITLFSTYARESIHFGTQSNFETSGGFGPNQVSSTLSLVAMMLLLTVLLSHFNGRVKTVLLVVSCVFMLQSIMTFSRGGAIATLLALLVAAPFITLTRKQKRNAIWATLLLALILPIALLTLNRFTGGKLGERYSESKMTGREGLMDADLRLWSENPVFGVGVGISKFAHHSYIASHTEFTRAVAESGTLGALAYIILGAFCVRRILQIMFERSNSLRPLIVSLMVWPWLYMVINASRTAGPSLALGMAFITVAPDIQRFLQPRP